MPRPLVIGNGNLLIALDHELSIRDFTFPYVGLYNHLNGARIRIGIWIDGRFSWLADPEWRKQLRYAPGTLATEVRCEHAGLALDLTLSDCVDARSNILLRRFVLVNRTDYPREARLFLTHDFHIAETDIGDTAFYDPFVDALVHYKRDNFFLISGQTMPGGIYQYSTGVKGFGGAEGVWRDAEDGLLSMNPIEQGSVDSAVSFRIEALAGQEAVIHTWVCVAHTMAEATRLHEHVRTRGFEAVRQQTLNYWTAWVHNETEEKDLSTIPAPVSELFRRSLLVIRTHVDNRGAILAATDSDIMQTARAHYAYMWARDGALVASALDRLGYQDITRRFFGFCRSVLPPDRPVLMHKYAADGSWGASWHPWVVGDVHEVPFQQDSTALTLWALWRHYDRFRDLEFIEPLYREFVVPAADFIVSYRDVQFGLPLPSYDLWEERRGINTYACSTAFGALHAAAYFARLFGDQRCESYHAAAHEIRKGICDVLWDPAAGRFARRLIVHADGSVERDLTLDSALYALFAFGACTPDDPRVRQTMRQVIDRLTVRTAVGGVARYECDYYFRRTEDLENVPGNPWIISTLWAAQYEIARADCPEALEQPMQRLLWATERAMESGVLPEQLHPYTGEPLSVAPLTWSHAEFVITTLAYLEKRGKLLAGPASH